MPTKTSQPGRPDKPTGDIIVVGDETFDLPKNLTVREFRLIKLQYGILGGHLDHAVAAGDQDAFAAYALTAIRRARPHEPLAELLDRLDDMAAGEIDIQYADDRKAEPPSPPA